MKYKTLLLIHFHSCNIVLAVFTLFVAPCVVTVQKQSNHTIPFQFVVIQNSGLSALTVAARDTEYPAFCITVVGPGFSTQSLLSLLELGSCTGSASLLMSRSFFGHLR